MGPLTTVLHPTDFAKHSECALELACALARDRNARLIVLYAVPGSSPATGGDDGSALRRAEGGEQDLKSYREEMRNKLEHLPLPGLRVRPERLLKEGEPVAVILAAAEETGCDLVVMGTHGREGEKLMGSVAEEVMQKAPCPVVAVKVPLPKLPPEDWLSPSEEVGVIL
jgi:nucleotide-binding universal stress UspA family protein